MLVPKLLRIPQSVQSKIGREPFRRPFAPAVFLYSPKFRRIKRPDGRSASIHLPLLRDPTRRNLSIIPGYDMARDLKTIREAEVCT